MKSEENHMSRIITKNIWWLILILVSCSSATTPTATSTPNIVPTNTSTPTITLTSTETPYKLSGRFCDPDDTAWAIKRMEEISSISTELTQTPTPEMATPSATEISQAFETLREKRIYFESIYTKRQLEVSLLPVPDCLKPAKKYLHNYLVGYVDFLELYNPEKTNTPIDLIRISDSISEAKKSYENEIIRIQECLPQGCPPPTE